MLVVKKTALLVDLQSLPVTYVKVTRSRNGKYEIIEMHDVSALFC